CILQSYFKAYI
ncbi:hypothetical protein FOXB_00674, partial [Fusarium oxysporum f. sp. conglutinans Fo5176]